MRMHAHLLCRTALAVALASVSVSLAPPAAWAQSESGRASINGRVTDATGAIVPGAAIIVRDNGTGIMRTLKADSAGIYTIPSLPVATYTLTFNAPGFGETRVDNILLAVGQQAEINVALKAASVATEVVVNSDDNPDLTHRTETANQTLINNDAVENLPTRGRNFTDFALLTPGISQEGDRFGLIVNGQRSSNANFAIDGVDFNDPLQGGQRGGPTSAYFFPQVAVREFQVVRTGASPEIGRTNAGFVNVVTKSGTNRFHGEGLYTNRNPQLTWPDALNDPEANNVQNQYAFGIGGPILHDKLFFFAGTEKTAFQVPFFVHFNSCPTAGYYDPSGLNPNCTLAAINLATPGSTAQPLPAFILNQEVPGFGLNNPLASSGRLDWQINPKNSALAQYSSTFLSKVQFGSSGVQDATASNNTTFSQQSEAFVLGLTTALSSTRTNDVRLQFATDNRTQQPNTPGAEIDISDLGNIGGNAGGLFIYRAIREELLDNYSWLLGRHQLRFGVDLNLEPETQQREEYPNGLWTVDTFIDYLKGLPTNYAGCPTGACQGLTAQQINAGTPGAIQFQQTVPFSGSPTIFRGTQREYAGYIQDTFHVHPRVTVNYGVRYEVELEPAGVANPAIPGTGVDPSDLGMIQPRAGVAWDVLGNGKTVLRASSGLFDARTPAYLLARDFTDNGLQNANLNSLYDSTILSAVPIYGALTAPPNAQVINDIYTNNPAFRNPRSAQAALTLEQGLTKRTALVVSFTNQETWALQHRLNTNLFQPRVDELTLYPVFPSINPLTGVPCTFNGAAVPCRPNSSIAGFHQNYSTAHSSYRSLVVQLRGQVTKRLSGTVNFTWANTRDDDSNERDYNRELALDSLCVACYNRGPSKQDIRDNGNLQVLYRLPAHFIFSSSLIVRTALPYSAQTSGSKQGDFNDDGNTANDRPILCSQVRFTVCAINPNAVNAYKGGAAVGYVVGRNTFREDGFLDWNMRMIKEFRVFKKADRLQFSAECLNCSRASNLNLGANQTSKFTHAQTTLNPITGYYYSGNNAGFMLNTYDTFRSGGPRQIQLGTRFLF